VLIGGSGTDTCDGDRGQGDSADGSCETTNDVP
jgi:hypothetical protein